MNEDVLRSYLIKLGVDVDTSTFSKMKNLLKDVENAIGKHASSTAMQMTKGAGITVGAYATVMVSIGKLIKKVADADMQYQLLAQKMYMSAEAVKAFKQATDTLGHSIDEIAWNAELKERYLTLVKDIQGLKVPEDAKDMMKQVRGVGFEFDRLKLASKLTLEQVAYNLLKLNKGELTSVKAKFTEMVDNAFRRIPEIAAKISGFLQPFITVGKSVIQFLKEFWELLAPIRKGLSWLSDKMNEFREAIIPDMLRQFAALSGILLAIFAIGSPILAGMAAVAAAMLLIDDLMAFKEGRESLEVLIPIWESLFYIINKVTTAIGMAMIAYDHWKHRKDDTYKNLSLKEDLKQWAEDNDYDKQRAERDEKRAGNKTARQAQEAKENKKIQEDRKAKEEADRSKISVAPKSAVPPTVTGNAKTREASLLKAMDEQGITDPKERAAFLAQASHETGGFKKTSEGSYSAARVWQLRGQQLSKMGVTQSEVESAYKTGGSKAMDAYMYQDKYRSQGYRMGNVTAEDATRYKGRGAFQLTGKSQYAEYGRELGIDLVNNPELANDPNIAAKIAVLYWKKKNLGSYARAGDINKVSAGINAGNVRADLSKVHGLSERQALYNQYLAMNQPPGMGAVGSVSSPIAGDTNQTTVIIQAQTNDPEALGRIAAEKVKLALASRDKEKNMKRRVAAG